MPIVIHADQASDAVALLLQSLSDEDFLHNPSQQQPSLELSLMGPLLQHGTNVNAGDKLVRLHIS